MADELDEEATRREIGQKFGECVATKRLLKPHAIRFVLSGSPQEGQELSHGNCLVEAAGGHVRRGNSIIGAWSTGVFRYIVADGLVRTDFATGGPADFSAVPPLDREDATTPGTAAQLADAVKLERGLNRLGECTARKNPEAVRLLAQTDVNSPAELAALRGLAPSLGACLEQGDFNFPRNVLRDRSVLAYARLAYALTAPAALQEVGK